MSKERWWTRRNGQRVRMRDMKTSHILNTMGMLERNANRRGHEAPVVYAPEWGRFEEELATRAQVAHLEDDVVTMAQVFSIMLRTHGEEHCAVAWDHALETP